MKLKFDRGEVEGTPEEIWRFLGGERGVGVSDGDVLMSELSAIRKKKKKKKIQMDSEKRYEQAFLDAHRVKDESADSMSSQKEELLQNVQKAELQKAIELQREALFPALQHADRRLAFQVFSRAAKLRNSLNFSTDGFVLGVEKIDEWKELCSEVITNADSIAKSVGLAPKVTNVGRDMIISFSGV